MKSTEQLLREEAFACPIIVAFPSHWGWIHIWEWLWDRPEINDMAPAVCVGRRLYEA